VLASLETALRRLWKGLRTLSGDDAYERYLAHWKAHRSHEGPPMDRKTFCRAELERKWNGVRRCC
jgi:uncharacterized short protein YbdD (DUF466 family)